jgi:uncharacterized protein (DUF58 family)
VSEKRRQIVDPTLLARVGGLKYRARGLAEGILTGHHKSPHHGASVEFAQHRQYEPGDEIRHIDWKAFAKTDRYHVKQFEDETNLRSWMLLDTSGSMDYGAGGRPTKLEYAGRLAAAFAWILLRGGDAVGLLTFNEKLGRYLPPRARPDHFWQMARLLEGEAVGGKTDIVAALRHIAEVAGRRGVVMLFSDCFQFDDRLIGLARQLRGRRHEVVVFHVLDPDELEFPFEDLTEFEDMETGQLEMADPRGMREQYLLEMKAFCEGMRKRLLEGDVRYVRVRTDEDPERVVLSFLEERRA